MGWINYCNILFNLINNSDNRYRQTLASLHVAHLDLSNTSKPFKDTPKLGWLIITTRLQPSWQDDHIDLNKPQITKQLHKVGTM